MVPRKPQALSVSSLKEAFRHFVNYTGAKYCGEIRFEGVILAKVYRWNRLKPRHIEKQSLDDFMVYDKSEDLYCVTFKREWMHSFKHYFSHTPDKTWGQIASLNLLLSLARDEVKYLVAIMRDGVAYAVNVKMFLDYVYRYKTDVPYLPGEVACPAKMWIRLFPGE